MPSRMRRIQFLFGASTESKAKWTWTSTRSRNERKTVMTDTPIRHSQPWHRLDQSHATTAGRSSEVSPAIANSAIHYQLRGHEGQDPLISRSDSQHHLECASDRQQIHSEDNNMSQKTSTSRNQSPTLTVENIKQQELMGGLAPLPDGGYIRGPASPSETLLRAGWQVQDALEADLDNGNGPHCSGTYQVPHELLGIDRRQLLRKHYQAPCFSRQIEGIAA
ncbi:unnamed protein product [Darwinula stevensoni]|uniref:Uncharacterized protein n=1 Tax=Darwinula stevensoni TaxID=69355 RepID=A0A7R8XFY2_9CRUS|nr:unnamed protein product [Darwinula stevensoni]CAG0895784.1 unnamed protein product [Darwinula stevensoni]